MWELELDNLDTELKSILEITTLFFVCREQRESIAMVKVNLRSEEKATLGGNF